MTRLQWCQTFIYLDGRPISFRGRPYLVNIYNSRARRIVLRCARQVEKTAFVINAVLHAAFTIPRVRIVIVFPRQQQARVFARRLIRVIQDSPWICRVLLGKNGRRPSVENMEFANKSQIFIRSAFHDADPVRGIPGDYLFVDEFQDIASGNLAILEECLGHSQHGRVIITGTPKTVDNHLEGAFNLGTACHWCVECECQGLVVLDQSCLGLNSPQCPQCQKPIDPTRGCWAGYNLASIWGESYSWNQLAVPWVTYPDLLLKRTSYDPMQFTNECLGFPTQLGDHVVTQEEVEACCRTRSMACERKNIPAEGRDRMIAGIDWGGRGQDGLSRTVLLIGYIRDDDNFVVVYMERLSDDQDPQEITRRIAHCCRTFQVQWIAADGQGNGSVYNNLLLNDLRDLKALYATTYTVSDQEPQQYKGRLWNWHLGRTPAISMVFTRIRAQRIRFPRLEDCRSFLPEIYCEVAQHDNHRRTIVYTHAQNQADDTLHALCYAVTLARLQLDRRLAFAS